MKRVLAAIATTALVLGFLAVVTSTQGFAASTSPGKNLAFESSDFNGDGDIPQSVTTLLTATIVKGKKKHVLMVEATLSTGSSLCSSYLYMRTEVNGVLPMEPRGGGGHDEVLQPCNSGPATLTGTWWLDLDAAEAAHPGVFIGQPLTVKLLGGEGFPAPQSDGKVTMSVRIQKK